MNIASIGFGLGAIVCLAMVVLMCGPMAIGMIGGQLRRRRTAARNDPADPTVGATADQTAAHTADVTVDNPVVTHTPSGGQS